MSGLPEGFVIDAAPETAKGGGLPEGFVIDEPGAMEKLSRGIRSVREAIHAPTRALVSGALGGQGDRVSAAMDTMLGQGAYGENLAAEQAKTADFAKAHPGAAQGLEIAGAMVPLGTAAKAGQGIPKALQGLSPVDQAILARLGPMAATFAEGATSAIPAAGPGLASQVGGLALMAAKAVGKHALPGYGAYELIKAIRGAL